MSISMSYRWTFNGECWDNSGTVSSTVQLQWSPPKWTFNWHAVNACSESFSPSCSNCWIYANIQSETFAYRYSYYKKWIAHSYKHHTDTFLSISSFCYTFLTTILFLFLPTICSCWGPWYPIFFSFMLSNKEAIANNMKKKFKKRLTKKTKLKFGKLTLMAKSTSPWIQNYTT